MIARTTLILLDSKPNRHSTNALVGALETAPDLDDLELRLPSGETQLEQHLAEASAASQRGRDRPIRRRDPATRPARRASVAQAESSGVRRVDQVE